MKMLQFVQPEPSLMVSVVLLSAGGICVKAELPRAVYENICVSAERQKKDPANVISEIVQRVYLFSRDNQGRALDFAPPLRN